MGRAARIAKSRYEAMEAQIEEEKRQHPHLWAKNYCVTLKRKCVSQMRKLGKEWETIGLNDGNLDSICESAEEWQPGAGQIVRAQLSKKGKA